MARPGPPMAPDPYGAFAAVDSLGGVASPLLAGFAVTLIALVLQIEAALRWPDAALALLAFAAVLFLQVVQLNARAKGYAVTPAQAKEWYDDLNAPGRREVVFWELRHHHQCWSHLVRQTRTRYNLGILALLAGTATMLVPREGTGLGAARLAAIVVIAIGAAVEILEMVAERLLRRPPHRGAAALLRGVVGWVVPLYPPVPRPPFPHQPSTDGRPSGPASARLPVGDDQSSSQSSSGSSPRQTPS